MKRLVPLIVSFIVGILMVGEFFIPHYQYHLLTAEIQGWGALIASAAFLLGLVNLLQSNAPVIVSRGPDWGYKLLMVLALLLTLVVGFLGGANRLSYLPFKLVNDYIFTPLNATMFALLAFYIASAAFRAFRARNFEATLLLTAAVIVMLGRVPLGDLISNAVFGGDYLGHFMNWIMDVPNNAARRAILIGSALGAMATGLRIILGIERSHLGGD
ncbi:MAG: hypothetical protein ACKO6N_06545 [Myxococcota bacterium]